MYHFFKVFRLSAIGATITAGTNHGFAVGDIEWAPYSSTVFAAVTSAGMLFVWDLDQGY